MTSDTGAAAIGIMSSFTLAPAQSHSDTWLNALNIGRIVISQIHEASVNIHLLRSNSRSFHILLQTFFRKYVSVMDIGQIGSFRRRPCLYLFGKESYTSYQMLMDGDLYVHSAHLLTQVRYNDWHMASDRGTDTNICPFKYIDLCL